MILPRSRPAAGSSFLAVITMLNAAAAAFYYLRVVVYMFMREPTTERRPPRHGRLLWGGLAVATALTILLGFFPGLDLPDHRPGRDRDRVHPAALPARPVQHRPDRLAQPLVGVADHQLHPGQAAGHQRAQEA